MAQFFEEVQRLSPGLVGRFQLVCRMVSVAEMGEGIGLVIAVAEIAIAVEGVPVSDGGGGVVAAVMAGVPDAVPGGRLAVPVAKFAVQAEGLLAARRGLGEGSSLEVLKGTVEQAGSGRGFRLRLRRLRGVP